MRYGLQMYGLNPLFLQDKEAFLKRITAAGFRYLEPCLMLADFPGFEDRGWTEEDFAANQPLLERYGVRLCSAHVFTENILEDLSQLIAIARTYGLSQLVLPCPKAINPATAIDLGKAGAALEKYGIELLLHNDRGDAGYEWLLKFCGGNVGAQADVGWLLHDGMDPESFLWRNQGRVRSLHYKDFNAQRQEVRVGTGDVDMMACFQFARAEEIIQILDQDSSQGDFLEDVEAVGALFHSLAQGRDNTDSILCTLDTQTGEVTQLQRFSHIIEAPNWMQKDPDVLIYNSEGRLYTYRISTGESTLLDTGYCVNCNNDHVLSPDNLQIAVSHSQEGWMSRIYILPIDGGTPRCITENAPSFLHGWSPDGKELCYCAFRDGGVDVFAVSRDGGDEWQLTNNAAFNDGPEYAPNGRHIWFNSTRSGLMQCWRMNRDGSEPTQMTFSRRNNWFPHVSPDGKQVVYLSYSRLGLDPNEHLPNMQVQLRLMDYDGENDRLLLEFFGGQGSVNVNSWHPDSRKLAFVQYQLKHK